MYMVIHSYTVHTDIHTMSTCWFVRGRIKEKISTIYAIKYQVYCMENTVQWSANTVQLF